MMADRVSVKVSSRYQITLPRVVRERLNIRSGDRLLVDVQDGLLILLLQPRDYTSHMLGLHREVWADLDAMGYLEEERGQWDTSGSD